MTRLSVPWRMLRRRLVQMRSGKIDYSSGFLLDNENVAHKVRLNLTFFFFNYLFDDFFSYRLVLRKRYIEIARIWKRYFILLIKITQVDFCFILNIFALRDV